MNNLEQFSKTIISENLIIKQYTRGIFHSMTPVL